MALNMLSTAVHRGAAFELRSLAILQNNLSMSLTSVGGRQDGGIDLIGWWWLPITSSQPPNSGASLNKPHGLIESDTTKPLLAEPRERIRIIAQCKAEKKRVGPKYVRELEGVLHRYVAQDTSQSSGDYDIRTPIAAASDHTGTYKQTNPANPISSSRNNCPAVAVLVSESPFTRSTVLRAMSSPIPFVLLHLPLPSPTGGREYDLTEEAGPTVNQEDLSGSAILNSALAGQNGLLRGQAEVRWERQTAGGGETGRFGLWWAGKRLKNWTP